MARNAVQFQKGLSEPAFEQQYGTEEQCRAVVIASRWPNGFECPVCGGRQHSLVASRDLYQCTKCRRQTSAIAGTIFASTHLPLRLWFRAIYHLTQTKQGISSIELGRRLGVTQTTAWKVKHKLKQVMLERDATKRLTGRVEIDDAYLGGERAGGKRGRGAPGKTPFVVAVETTTEGKPVRLKLRRVTSFCAAAISGFTKRSLDPTCSVVSDGLQCFGSVADAGCVRWPSIGSPSTSHPRSRRTAAIFRGDHCRQPGRRPHRRRGDHYACRRRGRLGDGPRQGRCASGNAGKNHAYFHEHDHCGVVGPTCRRTCCSRPPLSRSAGVRPAGCR